MPQDRLESCKSDQTCSAGCQVCCQLPYHRWTGQLEIHHYFTRRGWWNADQRLENINLQPGSLILYVGGNTDGADGTSFMEQCPNW